MQGSDLRPRMMTHTHVKMENDMYAKTPAQIANEAKALAQAKSNPGGYAEIGPDAQDLDSDEEYMQHQGASSYVAFDPQ